MRPFTFLCLAAVGAALEAPSTPNDAAPQGVPDSTPAITVLSANESYLVKLKCWGCPLAVRESAFKTGWEHDRDNSLLLKVDLDASESILYLNGNRILPLGPMPLHINAMQIPSDTSKTVMGQYIDMDFETSWPLLYGQKFPLLYEHTVLRTEEAEKLWLQFDVTGLPWAENPAPVKLDNQGQELLQLLLRQQNGTNRLAIEDLQIVQRKNRAQPYKMKCGNLAMVQTAFDPNEWDEYGKFGTWNRIWNSILGRGYGILLAIQESPLALVLALMFAVSIALVRHQFLQRQQAIAIRKEDEEEEEEEIALLGLEYHDAPPAYGNIPVIKIEEYD